MSASTRNINLIISLTLIAITSLAAYSWYVNYSQFPQTMVWIFGDPTNDINSKVTILTTDELSLYQTIKAYIDFLDATPGIKPHSSWSIYPLEAKSFISAMSKRTSEPLELPNFMGTTVTYGIRVEVSGKQYWLNFYFNDERPVLD